MSTYKKRLFGLILTAALVVGSIVLINNSKVVDAADNLVLLEKRHPGYWEYLCSNVVYEAQNGDEQPDVAIYPVSKIFKDEITTADYQFFLKEAYRTDKRKIVYFYDGSGFDVDKNIYGIVDANSWSIPDGLSCDWNSIKFEEKPINEVMDIYEYLQMLKDYSFIISVRDEASSGMNPILRNMLKNLGLLEELKFRDSYIAFANNGAVQVEQISHSAIEYSTGNISVKSAGKDCGDSSSITIGGEEFSKNLRGLNIVVMKDEKVIDSVNFDTCSKWLKCYR